MSGTKEGAKRAAATMKAKYGENYYSEMGKIGGKARIPKGYALMSKDKHREASAKGGRISRRVKKINS